MHKTIDSGTDIHVVLAQTQRKIEDHLGLDSDRLIFEYSQLEGMTRLDLITVNPRHNQSFLYHTTKGFDKQDALNKLHDYVINFKDKENHYTVQWKAKDDGELQTSYFRASSIYDALDKLYYGRDVNIITVFSVVLNPIT